MNEYPPITGKLRELVADVNWHEITDNIGGPWLDSWHRAMRDRCDTIDAIHARLEAAYDHLRAERDSMAAALDRAEGEHDFAPESHYVMLPKDADGVPIHVGDVLVHVNNLNISTKPFEVRSLVWDGDTWTVCDRLGPTVKHSVLRHHTPDTWERIIEDALDGYHDTDFDKLVARCKALAGDA